jgi:hypothetical protein
LVSGRRFEIVREFRQPRHGAQARRWHAAGQQVFRDWCAGGDRSLMLRKHVAILDFEGLQIRNMGMKIF